MNILKTHKTFGGKTQFWSHSSIVTNTEMKFATFIPEGPIKGALIWLSGLTCTEENFIMKAGAQRELAKQGLMVICPDTSPRGTNLPKEHDSYDFGSGAGFYVNSTTEGYKNHYRMFDYVTVEIYEMLKTYFKVDRISISGHSMGGHGALIIGLKQPEKFRSISALAPLSNPTNVTWGKNAFTGYLGNNPEDWKQYDAVELIKSGKSHNNPILVHQGLDDEFFTKGNLQTDRLAEQMKASGQKGTVHMMEGYDHSYYFVASVIDDHIQHHAQYLK